MRQSHPKAWKLNLSVATSRTIAAQADPSRRHHKKRAVPVFALAVDSRAAAVAHYNDSPAMAMSSAVRAAIFRHPGIRLVRVAHSKVQPSSTATPALAVVTPARLAHCLGRSVLVIIVAM
jgi:hypothetical protein